MLISVRRDPVSSPTEFLKLDRLTLGFTCREKKNVESSQDLGPETERLPERGALDAPLTAA